MKIDAANCQMFIPDAIDRAARLSAMQIISHHTCVTDIFITYVMLYRYSYIQLSVYV